MTIAGPNQLSPGMRVQIALAKTGNKRLGHPPRTLHFTVVRRDGDGWCMDAGDGRAGSRVPDAAPCYRDGRMVVW